MLLILSKIAEGGRYASTPKLQPDLSRSVDQSGKALGRVTLKSPMWTYELWAGSLRWFADFRPSESYRFHSDRHGVRSERRNGGLSFRATFKSMGLDYVEIVLRTEEFFAITIRDDEAGAIYHLFSERMLRGNRHLGVQILMSHGGRSRAWANAAAMLFDEKRANRTSGKANVRSFSLRRFADYTSK
jgi:hypothetical protein